MIKNTITNIITNYISKFWAIISIFVFVPLYIKFLGIESYAIIGFYTLILGIISFADSGMSSAIIKEFSASDDSAFKYSILIQLERLYILVCVVIFLIIFFGSHFIANKWLTSEKIPVGELSYFIKLIGLGVVIQLLSSLYYGALFGLHEQVVANMYQITWNVFKSVFVFVIFLIYKPSLQIYFIWQIICNGVYIIALRAKIVSILKISYQGKLVNILTRIPTNILNYIGGMTVIAIISALNSQADKIITSSFFTLSVYGYYNIGSILAQLPVLLTVPLVTFIFPLFSKFSGSEESDSQKLSVLFSKISYIINLLAFPTCILLILYTSEIVKLWTGSSINKEIFPILMIVIKLLAIGSLFLALQLPFFYLLLSKGKTKYTIYQGIVQIVFGLPLLYFCVKIYGLKAIGIPWLLINLGAFIFQFIIIFKKYINIPFFPYFINSIVTPAIITFLCCTPIYLLYLKFNCAFYLFLSLSGIVSILTCVIVNNLKRKVAFLNVQNLFDFTNQ